MNTLRIRVGCIRQINLVNRQVWQFTRRVLPDFLARIDRKTRHPHRFKQIQVFIHLGGQHMRPAPPGFGSHRVQHMQPGAVILFIVQVRGDVHNMRLMPGRTHAQLTHHCLFIRPRQQGDQTAMRQQETRNQGRAVKIDPVGKSLFAVQHHAGFHQARDQRNIDQFDTACAIFVMAHNTPPSAADSQESLKTQDHIRVAI